MNGIIALLVIIPCQFAYAQQEDYKLNFQCLEWAPDGESIAFTAIHVKPDWSDYSPGNWKLFTYSLKNKELNELGSSSLYLSYSPDGKMLAYDKNTPGNKKDIFLHNLSTGEISTLVAHKAKDGGPSWSPDGKQVVFYSDRGGNEQLYIVMVENGETRQLTHQSEHKSYNPIWSPKSDKIVYYFEKGDVKDQIYLTDSKGSYHRNLTNDDHHNIYPSWTPDSRIIYSRDKGEVMIMNADGTEKRQLLEKAGGLVKMDANGRRLLYSKSDGNLYIYDIEGATEQLILKAGDIVNR